MLTNGATCVLMVLAVAALGELCVPDGECGESVSLLQQRAHRELNENSVPTLAGECDDLDDVKEDLSAINETADAAADVASALNTSAYDILGEVFSSLDAASSSLAGIQTAVKTIAILNGGSATLELVDSFVESLSSSLAEVQDKLKGLVDTANEQVSSMLEKLFGVRDQALGQFASAVDQVTGLCDTSLLEVKATKPSDWFRSLTRGRRGDVFAAAEKAILAANKTVEGMVSALDDLNATATGVFTDIRDSSNTSLMTVKEEVLPKALASFDGKIPAPVMTIVQAQATAAIDQAFGSVGDLLDGDAVTEATATVMDSISQARDQITVVYAAADSLMAIVDTARSSAA